jgi:hypothetical protein
MIGKAAKSFSEFRGFADHLISHAVTDPFAP